MMRRSTVAVLFAVVVVAAAAVAVCHAAEVEAETDPHRLLSDKREKLRVVTAKAARDAAEAPLQEFEITDAGVTEVKTVAHDTKGVPKSVYYTSASSSGAAAGAALEHTVLMAVSETIRAHDPALASAKPVASQPLLLQTAASADPTAAPAAPAASAAAAPTAATPAAAAAAAAPAASKADVAPKPDAVNGLAHDASEVKGGKKAPSREALRKAAKRKAKGTLKCQCTFQPLPDKLPPLTPDQKNPKGAAEKEKKREQELLKKIAGGSTAKPAPAPATAAAATTTTAATAAAPASGTITPLKFVETSAHAAPTELATNADSSAAGAAPLFNAAYHADEALTDAAFVELDEAVAQTDADADADADAEEEQDDAEVAAEDETEAEADGEDETEAEADA